MGTPAFEEVKALAGEERSEQFQMVRHGHGLQLFSGKANEDGIVTKYEGSWARDKKHGTGSAVYADGSTYQGKFTRDLMDGEGTYKWAQGHEYKGQFRDGHMDGQGDFMHANGNRMQGKFKRSLFD